MQTSPPRCYWDSCVFLALINGEAARLPNIEACMDEAEAGEREIITSTYAVTEVAHAAHERAAGALDSTALQKIEELWKPVSSPVRLADFHFGIAEKARGLMRHAIEQGWKRLKPGDAIHLATAWDLRVDELNTFNLGDFKRWEPHLSMKVEEPYPFNPRLTP